MVFCCFVLSGSNPGLSLVAWRQTAAQTLTRTGFDGLDLTGLGCAVPAQLRLEWAGQAILMGNAAQELRTMASTRGWKQAPRNDQDGVAVVLEKAIAYGTKARS